MTSRLATSGQVLSGSLKSRLFTFWETVDQLKILLLIMDNISLNRIQYFTDFFGKFGEIVRLLNKIIASPVHDFRGMIVYRIART